MRPSTTETRTTKKGALRINEDEYFNRLFSDGAEEDIIDETTTAFPEASTTSSIDITIPINISSPEIGSALEEHLKTLINKIVTDVTTTEATANFNEEYDAEDSVESTTLSLSIPKLPNNMDAEALEQKLKELVIAVTERLESSTEKGIIDSTTNKINLIIDQLGAEYEDDLELNEEITTTTPSPPTRAGLPRRLDLQNSINVLTSNRNDDSKCWNVQFDCGNSTCININQRCNGIQDCLNGSDEENCQEGSCLGNLWECPREPGLCLSASQLCDGHLDCANGEDELNCSRDTCTEDQFYCAQDQRCIELTQVCNGVQNCASGEDEVSCQCNEAFQYKCQFGGGCVLSSKICDGFYDCADQSDEWNCFVSLDNGSVRARYVAFMITRVYL